MRRRTRQNNTPKLLALAGVLVLCIGGLGYAGLQAVGVRSADEFGCFESVGQSQIFVFFDASEPRFNDTQARSLRNYLDQLFERLEFNEKLSVFTSEGDVVSSVVKPRFHVCGQASSPEQLESMNAASGSTGYLRKQKQRLYEKVLAPELDALLTLEPDESRRQLYQSPILEMIKALSRDLNPSDRLILVSDLINNSDTVRFCRKKNDLPLFSNFKKRSVYQRRLKPQSLEGVEIEVLILQRHGYAQEELAHCHEDELQKFYEDYFVDNAVEAPRFIRIRHGYVGASK